MRTWFAGAQTSYEKILGLFLFSCSPLRRCHFR